ncbi:MAG: hypothetical protein EOP34_04660 [Rickettsiales bacterium]|nr:MAG: hypothetical protein EOP34_04660 [Rickettsiales bacterium]
MSAAHTIPSSNNSPKISSNGSHVTSKSPLFDGWACNTFREIRSTLNFCVDINVDNIKGDKFIKIKPFGEKGGHRSNEITNAMKFKYETKDNEIDSMPVVQEYTPDLSNCVIHSMSLSVGSFDYPADIKITTNKDEFNGEIYVDSEGTAKKIACVLPKRCNTNHVITEMPDHTTSSRALFMTKHPGLCGDIPEPPGTKKNEVGISAEHPMFKVMHNNLRFGRVESNTHAKEQDFTGGFISYSKNDYNKIVCQAIKRRDKVLMKMNLNELSLKIERNDGKPLNDPTGTIFQLTPEHFYNYKMFTIAFKIDYSINVAIHDEYLESGIITHNSIATGVEISKGVSLSVPLETRPNNNQTGHPLHRVSVPGVDL